MEDKLARLKATELKQIARTLDLPGRSKATNKLKMITFLIDNASTRQLNKEIKKYQVQQKKKRKGKKPVKSANDYFQELVQNTIKDMEYSRTTEEVTGINIETKESLDELIEINRLGFLTTDSQQGLEYYGEVPVDRLKHANIHEKYTKKFHKIAGKFEEDLQTMTTAEYTKYLEKYGGEPWDHWDEWIEEPTRKEYSGSGGEFKKGVIQKERAYLTGFVDTKKARNLWQILNQINNVVCWYTGATTSRKVRGEIPESFRRDTSIRVPVTYVSGPTLSDEFPLVGTTSLPNLIQTLAGTEAASDHGLEIPERVVKQFSTFYILDGRYGHHVRNENGLFKKVIAALRVMKNKK
uniref:Uncharacterized protein n=1 Tax=Pithovirus LCPAC304 TaxID=2506594 RepID=A0A481Z8J2_9VIRU|nr:MAG: uncharacterized protein LCPAC304_05800 [Pithovirus LCPAC304]